MHGHNQSEDDMATRLPWLTGVDRVVLDWLRENDIVFSPTVLHHNLERDLSDPEVPSYSQLARRVRILRGVGLLEPYDDEHGKYELSDLGKRFLDGELEDEERERLATIDPDELDPDG